MHIVTANYFYDRKIPSADALLERYSTLVGWADGIMAAGGMVTVVQRFSHDDTRFVDGVRYIFVRCPSLRMATAVDPAARMNRVIADLEPDVVHINSLKSAHQAVGLKRLLPGVPILLQDHANHPPRRAVVRWALRRAIRHVDAVSFAARDLGKPWLESHLIPPCVPIFELMEGSSHFALRSRALARRATGLEGRPVCLWVGRLNANKDPLCVLRGFAQALPSMPDAHLVMVFDEQDLYEDVRRWLDAHADAARRITMRGRVAHGDLEAVYNSSDFFLLGSHQEGSGYAVLEAMACGCVPIVTDIPSFRTLVGGGEAGGLWPVGDAGALAGELVSRWSRLGPETPAMIRRYFDDHWSIEAIGCAAMQAYRELAGGGT